MWDSISYALIEINQIEDKSSYNLEVKLAQNAKPGCVDVKTQNNIGIIAGNQRWRLLRSIETKISKLNE